MSHLAKSNFYNNLIMLIIKNSPFISPRLLTPSPLCIVSKFHAPSIDSAHYPYDGLDQFGSAQPLNQFTQRIIGRLGAQQGG
jgi:hypothetical protein